MVILVFFFFKQKTAYEMRISDWSSDVCSSDLFTAMFDRIRLPMETMTERCREKDPDNDPLGTLRKIFILVLRETVRNPHRRRVLDILFHKCEYTEEIDRKSTRLNSSH